MVNRRDLEISEPASQIELSQFVGRLEDIKDAQTLGGSYFSSIHRGCRIILDDGTTRSVNYDYQQASEELYGRVAEYTITVCEAVQVSKQWFENAVDRVRSKEDQGGLFIGNGAELPLDTSDLSPEEGEYIGGYLQRSVELTFLRMPDGVKADKETGTDVLDNEENVEVTLDWSTISPRNGLRLTHTIDMSEFEEELSGEQTTPDEILLEFLPSLTGVTRADLVIAAQGLISVGLLSGRARAYRGAPKDVPGARFFDPLP